MYIQTVYLPQENMLFVEDWIKYHLSIGVEHFFMYDNTGSKYRYSEKNFEFNLIEDSKNKYGEVINISVDDALEQEEKIFKKYPVTKTIWQPIENGKITYGQMDACVDFASKVNEGLCAFIDIDEFIIKKEDFRESRILQKKYDSRWRYKSVFDCDKTFDINTRNFSSKVILDMANFEPDFDIHFGNHDLPISKSFFNHYNHNESSHKFYKWLLSNYHHIDPSWTPVPYEDVFVSGEKLKMGDS